MPRTLFAIVISSLLFGCASYQPSAEERGVSFALPWCDDSHLELASGRLKARTDEAFTVPPLSFNHEWVCRTRALTLDNNWKPLKLDELTQELLEAMAFENNHEIALRKVLESSFLRDTNSENTFNQKLAKRPTLGIALSGGGTKAAAFATGVLAGLSDSKQLETADYLSSVSGGVYASYFFYSQQLMPKLRQAQSSYYPLPTQADLYRDCIIFPSQADASLRARILSVGGCKKGKLLPEPNGASHFDNRFQAFLRCQQDIFRPGNCNTGIPISLYTTPCGLKLA